MINLYKYLLILFLLLPKIPVSATTGIMAGELLLFVATFFVLITNHKEIAFKPLVLLLFTFFTWFVLVSSLINGLVFSSVPISAIVYYIKIVNYFMLFWVAYRLYLNVGFESAKKVFFNAYLWHYVIAMGIVVFYYATHRPSVGDIMWNYETGLRAIPIAGLTIAPGKFAGLAPVGGGSSNLFVSWSLAFVLIAIFTKDKRRSLFLLLGFLVPLFGMSRGGILTFVVLFLYLIFISSAYSQMQKMRLSLIMAAVTGMLVFVISNSSINIPNVFERFSESFESGGKSSSTFDPSTQGRLENYKLVFDAWSDSPVHVLFGLGMDEEVLIEKTGWGLVESFFLQVLFCSGITGIFLLFMFFFLIYLARKRNVWFYTLWMFILLESLFMWSITGGDFYSSHVMYVIMVLLGYGYAQSVLSNIQQHRLPNQKNLLRQI